MKASLAALVLAVALLTATASSASAAPPSTTALQKQVTALQKQVKNLNTAVNVLFAIEVCQTALIADTFQQTFGVLDKQFSGQTPPVNLFNSATLPKVDDKQACQALKLNRPAGPAPTTAAFSALAALLSQ